MSRRGRLIVMSAPSGTGKSSVVRRLLATDARIAFSVSATTRAPRAGEVDGRDYHFMSEERFETRVQEGAFLEHALVHGRRYGTLRSETERRLAEGMDVVLDVDVQGARSVARAFPEAELVFLLPPSRDELERRLRGRGGVEGRDLDLRLANARTEIAELERFAWVILNDDVERAAREFAALVAAFRLRTDARRTEIAAVRASFGLDAGGGGGAA